MGYRGIFMLTFILLLIVAVYRMLLYSTHLHSSFLIHRWINLTEQNEYSIFQAGVIKLSLPKISCAKIGARFSPYVHFDTRCRMMPLTWSSNLFTFLWQLFFMKLAELTNDVVDRIFKFIVGYSFSTYAKSSEKNYRIIILTWEMRQITSNLPLKWWICLNSATKCVLPLPST